MIAAFQSTGAKYGRKNLRWLFSIPSAHADSTSRPVIGNRIRTTAIESSRRCPSNPGVNTLTMNGASGMPMQADGAGDASSNANAAPATRPASSVRPWPSSAEYAGMNDAESVPSPSKFCSTFGSRNPALQHVGMQTRAEVRREHPLADQADDAAQEDSEADEKRGRARRPRRSRRSRSVAARIALGCRHQRIVTSSSALVG